MAKEVTLDLSFAAEERAWGGDLAAAAQTLVRKMGPVLQDIKEGSAFRESSRTLPYSEINSLKQTGFLSARLKSEAGGYDATLPELFELVVSVAEADPNIAQALRSHFGFVEHILTVADDERRDRWLHRLASGDLVAAAATETGSAKQESFSTTLNYVQDEWRLNGTKAYATGALFADWIDVEATGADGEGIAVLVAASAPGVTVNDDWDGFGQKLSASGTVHFDDVHVQPEDITRNEPFPYYEAFYQLYLLAILAGIGRAASNDVSALLASRNRAFSHGSSSLPSDDPQLQQVAGEVRSSAYAAGAIVARAAHAVQRAYEHSIESLLPDSRVALAEVEVWQAQQAVSDLVLSATTRMFDALGGSATLQKHGLDRHWRNARTLASHNPAIYKSRIVGNYAVNGENPPGQWRVGVPPSNTS